MKDVDGPTFKRQLCGGNEAAIEKMLVFGRDLQNEFGKNEANKTVLQVFLTT